MLFALYALLSYLEFNVYPISYFSFNHSYINAKCA